MAEPVKDVVGEEQGCWQKERRKQTRSLNSIELCLCDHVVSGFFTMRVKAMSKG